MKYEIQNQPAYSVLEVTIDPSESIVAESGAMVWMSDSIQLSTSARGGVFKSLRRSVLGGESFLPERVRGASTSPVSWGSPPDNRAT